jgi:hypothetical protein
MQVEGTETSNAGRTKDDIPDSFRDLQLLAALSVNCGPIGLKVVRSVRPNRFDADPTFEGRSRPRLWDLGRGVSFIAFDSFFYFVCNGIE